METADLNEMQADEYHDYSCDLSCSRPWNCSGTVTKAQVLLPILSFFFFSLFIFKEYFTFFGKSPRGSLPSTSRIPKLAFLLFFPKLRFLLNPSFLSSRVVIRQI